MSSTSADPVPLLPRHRAASVPDAVEVRTSSRVHVTLIDMNGAAGRRDGGVGFAVADPGLRLVLARGGPPHRDEAAGAGNERAAAAVRHAAAALGVPAPARVRVRSTVAAHSGLGSGTQLRLAALRGLAELEGLDLGDRELAALSGRGGTSGIGVHAFTRGGFLVDGGHRTRDKEAFAPSRFAEGLPVPPLLYARTPPAHWGVVLAMPEGVRGLEGVAERDFMAAHTPVPLPAVEAVAHTVLMGLLPALEEGDLAAFGDGLTRLQDIGWKQAHWQRPELRRWRPLVGLMRAEGAAGGGLSSTGPLVYAVYDRTRHGDGELTGRIRAAADRAGLPLASLTTTTFGGPAATVLPEE
ncbi:beta-ribofuranosylaminobenzene 5'-phosphate synthase [Streptomyces sp. V3I8]|uniref:beta-ribofuranosylaminobenzene 5'-phosphate synthase family protein n=1 Tax=Streptomyces sp. V3I8 TaxID=3042279 RepID=UPI002785BE2A|nr:beta-ribofuranosylaminobenzene 5'-phosphate synthase family protein [Streptomyces sp. V3I8]MDQ1034660.1 beta-ribofuranosylaminobenzene 5'-phosphate synthase [Streptomyces sp. V3I8]